MRSSKSSIWVSTHTENGRREIGVCVLFFSSSLLSNHLLLFFMVFFVSLFAQFPFFKYFYLEFPYFHCFTNQSTLLFFLLLLLLLFYSIFIFFSLHSRNMCHRYKSSQNIYEKPFLFFTFCSVDDSFQLHLRFLLNR